MYIAIDSSTLEGGGTKFDLNALGKVDLFRQTTELDEATGLTTEVKQLLLEDVLDNKSVTVEGRRGVVRSLTTTSRKRAQVFIQPGEFESAGVYCVPRFVFGEADTDMMLMHREQIMFPSMCVHAFMPYFKIAGNTLVANIEAQKHFAPGTRKPRSMLAKIMVDVDPELPFLMLPGLEYKISQAMQATLIDKVIPEINGENMDTDVIKNTPGVVLVFRPNSALVKLKHVFDFVDKLCSNMDLQTLITLYSCMTQLADVQGSKTSDTATTRGMDAISLCNWQRREIMLSTKGNTDATTSLLKIIEEDSGAPTSVDARDDIEERRKSAPYGQQAAAFDTSEYRIEPCARFRQ